MNSRLPSLRGLTVIFLALFLIVTVAAGVGTFLASLWTIDELVDRRVHSESVALARPGAPVDVARLARRIGDLTRQRDTGDLGLVLLGANGHRVAGNAYIARPLPLGFSDLGSEDRIAGLSHGRVLVRDIGDGMRLAVFAETEPVDNYFAARRRIYLIGFGAIIAVVLSGLILMRRLIGQRIDAMRRTADSIIDGDLSRRVPINGDGGEFDQQAAAFNRMLDRINALMDEIRNVSNDVAHELRTPLAKLRNELALLGQQPDLDDARSRIAAATAQADDLLNMFAALLRIAEIESGSRRLGFRSFDVAALVEEAAETVLPAAEEAGHTLSVVRADGGAIVGDRQLLFQMLLNLLENACNHTPVGTAIRLSASSSADRTTLAVEDDGAGVAEEHWPLIMRRFGTADASRRRAGHGLGLPLASAIARLHGGALVLENARPGLRIVVTLPRG